MDVDTLSRRLSNWGRWGADDQIGTLNLVTERKRLEAALCVRRGDVYSLALELQSDMPQPAGSGRLNLQHLMVATGTDAAVSGDQVEAYADDVIYMSVHASTHWDALSHVFHHRAMYNGRGCGLVTARGAAMNDIVPVARRMVTRGVLIDVARYLGKDALPCDHKITVAELEGALSEQRVDVSCGDALLIRTGYLGQIRAAGNWAEFTEVDGALPAEPGIAVGSLPWLHELGVAAVACDNWAVEWLAGPQVVGLPVHTIGIVHMGLLLGEIFELDALATACAGDGRYEFLLAAGPLPIRGGVGGPVNPMAVR